MAASHRDTRPSISPGAKGSCQLSGVRMEHCQRNRHAVLFDSAAGVFNFHVEQSRSRLPANWPRLHTSKPSLSAHLPSPS